MAVRFVARKCTQCAGKLQYIKEKKLWKCLYCGAEIERQEQYDGLFTIKNVVRQALLDAAYRRLDSAAKNLVECEKIDARYVGTLIAKITYEMVSIITPGACSERDVRNLFAQLKRDFGLLRSSQPEVSDEEEALYEFLEEADIFATLVLVYDSLNDTARRDYVAQLLDAKQIYSKEANGNLLTYALKNGKLSLADDILQNTNNIDTGTALVEVLQKYPDTDAKSRHAAGLIQAQTPSQEERTAIEKYLTESKDSAGTKAAIVEAAVAHGVDVSLARTIQDLLPAADAEQVRAVLAAYCSKKLDDADVLRILEYACSRKDAQTALGALDGLTLGGQYVLVPSKSVICVLSERSMSASDKKAILEKLFCFKIDTKSIEAVVNHYLCFNQDPVPVRKEVLSYLLEKTASIPTNTVQTYILQCAVDGTEKPEIVRQLFAKGLNMSFFQDLLSKYMASCIDTQDVKAEIVEILASGGLKMDPSSLIDYICRAKDDVPAKIKFVRNMVQNGSQLRSDAASAYLETTPPEQFSSELFDLILTPASTFGPKAVERYLLSCKEREPVKAQNFRTLAERCTGGVGAIVCQVNHAGNSISCSLLQAYVLCSSDTQALTQDIAGWLITQKKLKLNTEIVVSGQSMKFKKYVASNRDKLSGTTDQICEQYRVYSMLF